MLLCKCYFCEEIFGRTRNDRLAEMLNIGTSSMRDHLRALKLKGLICLKYSDNKDSSTRRINITVKGFNHFVMLKEKVCKK